MALAKAAVRFTSKLETNLAQIAAFWAEREAPQAYASLLAELGDTVVPNLERHPRIGRKFFAHAAQSVEVREKVSALLKRLGGAEVREYLSGDYLVLYSIVAEGGTSKPGLTVYLLAIKHGRQLSFNSKAFGKPSAAGRVEALVAGTERKRREAAAGLPMSDAVDRFVD